MSSPGSDLANDAVLKAQVVRDIVKQKKDKTRGVVKELPEKDGEKSHGAGEWISDKAKAAKEGTKDAVSKTGEKKGEAYDKTQESVGRSRKLEKRRGRHTTRPKNLLVVCSTRKQTVPEVSSLTTFHPEH